MGEAEVPKSERGDVMTGDVMVEAEVGVIWLLALKTEESHEPQNAAASSTPTVPILKMGN